jgi:hypothetical protein
MKIKSIMNKIDSTVVNLSVCVFAGGIVGVLLGAIIFSSVSASSSKEKAKIVGETTAAIQHQAISAGVAEYVITNKFTGQSTFRWVTNTPKYLFAR